VTCRGSDRLQDKVAVITEGDASTGTVYVAFAVEML